MGSWVTLCQQQAGFPDKLMHIIVQGRVSFGSGQTAMSGWDAHPVWITWEWGGRHWGLTTPG